METFIVNNIWLIVAVIIWTLPWKGWALWKAARLYKKWWFIFLLIINTAGLFEILYIFIFSNKKQNGNI